MGNVLSTLDVRKPERFSYWCDAVCDVFVQLDVTNVIKSPTFFGSIDTSYLDDLQFSDVVSENQRVVRSMRQISKATQDYFLVSFQLSGRGLVTQGARTAVLHPGYWALYDTTRPYELNFTEPFEQLVLQMPRDKLKSRLILSQKTVAQAINGNRGLGKVTLDLIMSAWREIGTISPQQLDRLYDTITELLATCLNESIHGNIPSARSRIVRLMEIKKFINIQLRNPLLNVEMIANASHLSTRYVHLLFKDEDATAASYIREQRLQKCKQNLQDINQFNRSITDIAYSWGFNSSAHFSSSFSERFGVSPREYRASINRNSA
ncbi:MAG: helix-turn-helix domain-containing protein [Desulfobacteraceae bacterium]|nr:helix-turn-helix domain-containing protein [Desulfobacteraceae bacterium]